MIQEHVCQKLGLPRHTVGVMMSDWTFTDYPAFEVMVKDNEVHMLAKNKFLPRGGFRDVFGPLIEKYGCVTTRCAAGDAASIEFVERIGFNADRESAGIIYYRIDHVPFQSSRSTPMRKT